MSSILADGICQLYWSRARMQYGTASTPEDFILLLCGDDPTMLKTLNELSSSGYTYHTLCDSDSCSQKCMSLSFHDQSRFFVTWNTSVYSHTDRGACIYLQAWLKSYHPTLSTPYALPCITPQACCISSTALRRRAAHFRIVPVGERALGPFAICLLFCGYT